ncbi:MULTISPECIES: TAXI family TRAP transporter solute-binding subunit [unclassified Modicisalibacter]|uniref:TAXI family TRAP transporter solute-binding subunit n=1 Tax=unclassified Modicisalibacter TaxID=2679913 RepID=UPI001CC92670|nr:MULTISPECIES: TAXI family TRAP transporter solute-binding subunit [unclassified Modicisalibacter]MBZ9558742.1 TAXI family TRAP transporter solute-binding subunit [Modicisalibacter sp. R2A 31.J]MBZ9575367.1 TAXI family TRAP transporter solute-binding subunit [Modicisalibacter sp. MOD 31.J]
MKTLLTAMAASLAVLAASAAAHAEERLLIGSTSSSSSHYGYFVAVNQIINNQVDGVSSSVAETGATVDNLRRISRRQIDLGLVTTNTGYHAYKGVDDFEGHAVDSRLLWVYTVAPQNAVVREDSGVTALEGLEDVRFNPGITGSATEATTEAVMKTLGIQPDYVRGSTTDIVSAIKDDRLAGYVKSGVGDRLDGSTMDIATFTPVRILSLSDDQAATLREKMPDIGVVDIPEGAGEGIPAYKTWAFGVAVHARPGLDEATAYRIVKAVMENPEPQANAFSAVKGADMARMTLDVGTVPLHPGAARYYREQGLEIPDALQPVE